MFLAALLASLPREVLRRLRLLVRPVGVVGRPGLEPGTYGLKVDRIYVGHCHTLSQCITLSTNSVVENV